MSNISLFSGGGFSQPDKALVRRMDTALQVVEAKAAVAHSLDQTRATLAASAMNNIGNLTSLAEQIIKTTPASTPYMEMAIRAYAMNAAQMIGDFR